MTCSYECNYMFSGPEAVTNGLTSDFKAAMTVDAFPPYNKEGHVVATIFLTTDDHFIVSWHDNGERMNPEVLQLLKEARQTLLAAAQPAVTSPAEKARQEMLAFARTQIVPKELFGKSIEFVPLAALESFLQKHLHDSYDYSAMNQPEMCIHHPGHTCGYPISDCPNCPLNTGDFPGTTCSIQ